MKFRCVQQLFGKIIYMEFHKNPINGLITDIRSQADKQTDMISTHGIPFYFVNNT